jgi:hypothetical protein
MSTGAGLMFGFGVIWLVLGSFRGRPLPSWARISLQCLGVALVAAIATLAVRAAGFPRAPQIASSRQVALHFYVILCIELGTIFLAVIALRAIHYPDYILCGIAFIVGVHFFPLAALFRMPLYYGTGLGGCAIGLIGFFMTDAVLRQKVVGISFGLLLWATAGWIAWVGLAALRVAGNLRPM